MIPQRRMTFQRQINFRDQMLNDGVRVVTDNYKEWRSCLHKRRYSLKSDADAVVIRVGKGYSYFCTNDGCHGFHVTTQERDSI